MDHDWGDWPEDEYGADTGDTADTAELGGGEEPAPTAGFESFDEPGPAEEPGPHEEPAGLPAGAGEGYLEDDPMAGFGAEPDSAHEPAEPADEPGPHDEPAALDADLHDDADTSPETVVGADPDVDPEADWTPPEFPGQLDVSPPEPVDGYPWSDANAVAAPGTAGEDPSVPPAGAPPPQDLLDYAGSEGGGDPWAALVGSDDPAASSLGRWWSPS